MRCFLLFILPVFIYNSLSAQNTKKKDAADTDKVFTKIEINAVTDNKKWAAYLNKSTVLTVAEQVNIPPGVYKITVQFVVDNNGYIADVTAKNNPGYGLAKKAENIISNYEGVWTPAIQCGRTVKSYKVEVVSFVVNNQ